MTAKKVVVFIDAENVAVSAAAAIMDEAARHGTVLGRGLYGDFIRRSQPASWLEVAPLHALTPHQTSGSTSGKNGADIALVIDAVEMLCRNEADVFCIATSDGDFTQLAMRIRQDGKVVVGLGRSTASRHFQEACDTFVTIETVKVRREPASLSAPAVAKKVTSAGKTPSPQKLEADLLNRVFVAAPRLDDEWVILPDLMKALQACKPGFTVKTYGHSQLCKLLAFSDVELADKNRKARRKMPMLKKVVDNG